MDRQIENKIYIDEQQKIFRLIERQIAKEKEKNIQIERKIDSKRERERYLDGQKDRQQKRKRKIQ